MAEAFTWGPGGETETTSSRARRRLAEALMMEGTSSAPIQSAWQGVDRLAKALMGGFELRQEDERDRRQEQQTNELMATHPALAAAGAAPAVSPGVARVTSAVMGDGAPATVDSALPRGIRNNNPLNIEAGNFTSGIPGYAGSDGRFAKFESPDGGITAANKLLDVYRDKHGLNTVAGIIGRWAPTSDGNNVSAYAANVSRQLGIDPTAPIPPEMRPQLIAAMGQHENGRPINMGGAPAAVTQDPAVIPTAAQPAQGYAIPGQPAGQPAPIAGPQMPPAVASWVRQAIRNPATRSSALGIMQQYAKPRESFGQETDADGNIWSINQQTGQRVLAMKKDKPAEAPNSVREYEYYRGTLPSGQQPMPYDTWATSRARAAATNDTLNAGGGSDKQIFDEFVDRSKSARATAQGLVGIRNAREAIEGGAITGFRADNRAMLQKAGKYFGLTDAKDVENGEVFKAAIAPQVAAVLKSTVGTANISDSDRRFAERARRRFAGSRGRQHQAVAQHHGAGIHCAAAGSSGAARRGVSRC